MFKGALLTAVPWEPKLIPVEPGTHIASLRGEENGQSPAVNVVSRQATNKITTAIRAMRVLPSCSMPARSKDPFVICGDTILNRYAPMVLDRKQKRRSRKSAFFTSTRLL